MKLKKPFNQIVFAGFLSGTIALAKPDALNLVGDVYITKSGCEIVLNNKSKTSLLIIDLLGAIRRGKLTVRGSDVVAKTPSDDHHSGGQDWIYIGKDPYPNDGNYRSRRYRKTFRLNELFDNSVRADKLVFRPTVRRINVAESDQLILGSPEKIEVTLTIHFSSDGTSSDQNGDIGNRGTDHRKAVDKYGQPQAPLEDSSGRCWYRGNP